MTIDKIKQYIKEAHENSIDKGFYDCPECGGSGFEDDNFDYSISCKFCNRTGMNPNANIGEKLMLIVSELGEALEAHRKNKFAKKDHIKLYLERSKDNFRNVFFGMKRIFETEIKDTFEDEIADVFIRFFDLCGYLNIEPGFSGIIVEKIKNIPEYLFFLTQYICGLYHKNYGLIDNIRDNIKDIFVLLGTMCHQLNIDIEKHIELKMAYNKTRPRKHGKEY